MFFSDFFFFFAQGVVVRFRKESSSCYFFFSISISLFLSPLRSSHPWWYLPETHQLSARLHFWICNCHVREVLINRVTLRWRKLIRWRFYRRPCVMNIQPTLSPPVKFCNAPKNKLHFFSPPSPASSFFKIKRKKKPSFKKFTYLFYI